MVLCINLFDQHGVPRQDAPSLAQAEKYIYSIDFTQLMGRLATEEGWSQTTPQFQSKNSLSNTKQNPLSRVGGGFSIYDKMFL